VRLFICRKPLVQSGYINILPHRIRSLVRRREKPVSLVFSQIDAPERKKRAQRNTLSGRYNSGSGTTIPPPLPAITSFTCVASSRYPGVCSSCGACSLQPLASTADPLMNLARLIAPGSPPFHPSFIIFQTPPVCLPATATYAAA